MLKPAIAMTLYARPEATRKVFDCLLKCRELENFQLFVSLDRHPDDRIYESVHGVMLEYRQRLPADSEFFTHSPKLNIDSNKLFVLGKAFENHDYVVFLNDDTPISEDGLNWFLFAGEKYKNDQSVHSISGYNRLPNGVKAEDVDPYAYCVQTGYGVWGFALWKDRFDKYFGVDGEKYIAWCRDTLNEVNGAFDEYCSYYLQRYAYPLLPRTQHSEWEQAEHTKKDDGGAWFLENEFNGQWAGLVDLSDSSPEWHEYLGSSFSGVPERILRIVFDADHGGFSQPWWPGSFSGGSEWQMIAFAEELAKFGHRVTCRLNCTQEHAGLYNGVHYMHFEDGAAPECDVYCSQRMPWLLSPRKAPFQILLIHDIPDSPHFPTKDQIASGFMDNIDLVVALNNYHKKILVEWGCPEDRVSVCKVMCRSDEFELDHPKIGGRCIYCSCPDRGLKRLLEYWPKIKELSPQATLQICWNVPIVRDWFRFANGDKSLGILPQKVLTHEQLADELSQAELLTYPSDFGAEISPMACIKAQAAGAVPLVVVASDGMDEVTAFGHKADYGNYPIAASNALNDDGWRRHQRSKMVHSIRVWYNPSRIAKIFMGHIWRKLGA